jgi:site-specific DNA-adenine methylase
MRGEEIMADPLKVGKGYTKHSQQQCKLIKGWYYKDGKRGYRCAFGQDAAYGGQRSSAEQITKMLPKAELYVEPFAGHAYNWQNMKKHDKIGRGGAVLADKNCAAIDWIRKSRKTDNTVLKCQDWRKTVVQTDSKNTLTLFDPPWDDPKDCYKAYKGNCTQFAPEIVKMATKMKGTAVLLDRDTPDKRKIICKAPSPFKCHYIKVNGTGMMKKKVPWSEIVAIKK